MDLRRKAYDRLLEWKREWDGRSAILIEGARGVGKTHLARLFAEREYRSYILIDLSSPPEGLIPLFERNLRDIDLFFDTLSAIYGVRLHRRESAIVLDGVQAYPHARALIKFLVADGRYDYIETGSFVFVESRAANILFPSEEDRLMLDPLDFEEFLWAMGDDMTYPYLRRCLSDRTPVGKGVHERVMDLFRLYMLVGGMPRAVIEYATTRDLWGTERVKRGIMAGCLEDAGGLAAKSSAKVLRVLEAVPSELSRKEKRFRITSLGKDARTRDYEDALTWLTDGCIVSPCFNSADPTAGLHLNLDRPTMKLYMADTGLLVTLASGDDAATGNDLYRAVLTDRLDVNEGMIAENVVSQMLHASGHRLFFYSSWGEASEDRMEVDFVISSGHKIHPVEVRSSRRRTSHSSLDKYRRKFGGRLGEAYLLYPGDVRTEDGIVYLPLYMAGLLRCI